MIWQYFEFSSLIPLFEQIILEYSLHLIELLGFSIFNSKNKLSKAFWVKGNLFSPYTKLAKLEKSTGEFTIGVPVNNIILKTSFVKFKIVLEIIPKFLNL